MALGRVREVDRVGNNEADAAADLGSKRVLYASTDARRLVNRACARFYPVAQELHRFFIAIARTALDNDGVTGATLHPVVWSAVANPKRSRVEQAVRNFAWLPGPVHLWASDWFRMLVACIGEGDVAAWPFSVGLLAKFAHFLGSLHWPCGAGDLGVGGVSYLELLILYERWAGERLVQFQCRLFRLVQALILSALVVLLAASSGFLLCYLVGWLGFCLVVLVRIIAGLGIWAGKGVGMV